MNPDELQLPIVLAPLAGGPATVELAVAVSEAGGLGFLAAGYLSAADMRAQVERARAATGRPFGVNVFAPPTAPAEPYEAYVASLREEEARAGAALGTPRSDDDDWAAKIDALAELAPPVVSFVFGCPSADILARLQAAGSSTWVSATTPAEAARAEAAGAQALVLQGAEAGGHRAAFDDRGEEPYGLLALLQLVSAASDLPLVAAGGIATGAGVAGALAAGAGAAQVGTAFLRCPEAGTAEVHRAAIAGDGPTALTRAFSGKLARGIVNRFMREHPDAPSAYPEIHHVTSPLRKAARASGDGDLVNLWAGQAHALATAEPAGDVARRLAAEAREAASRLARRLGT
jgi:nitronate monooxygenase